MSSPGSRDPGKLEQAARMMAALVGFIVRESDEWRWDQWFEMCDELVDVRFRPGWISIHFPDGRIASCPFDANFQTVAQAEWKLLRKMFEDEKMRRRGVKYHDPPSEN